jgi:outer membrane scaffolding protein for murein synthesis (MipA/OmpV family)
MKLAMVCIAGLLQVAAGAQANDGLMPEGSVDAVVSVLVGSRPLDPGSAARTAFVLPQFFVEWSNGVFIDGLAAGVKLSDDPLLQYGPLVALGMAPRTDGAGSRMRPAFGAFVDYTPLHQLRLHAHVVAPATRHGRGGMLTMHAGTHTQPAPHHVLAASVGVNLADAGYLQSEFGAAGHQLSGGVRDVFAGVRWHWEMSRKVKLTASVQASVLQGSAAASPRTVQRTGVTSWLALGYHF